MTNDTKFSQLCERARLAWAILRGRDANLVAHAKRELRNSLSPDAGEMDQAMAKHMIDMVRVFSGEGHSGFSAGYARHTLSALLDFKPLGPLTGDRCEWVKVYTRDGATVYQNNRCGHVFREIGSDSVAEYDTEGVIFREPDGGCFHSFYSRVPINFPYAPKRVYADVPFNATDEQKTEAARLALEGALQ